jgi:hypothetical protein
VNEGRDMRLTRFAIFVALVAVLAACRPFTRELEPTPPERTDIPQIPRQIPPHESMPGTNAHTALLFTHEIPGMRARIEVREYYVSEGTEVAIASPSEALFEIRSGKLNVEARDVKGEHLTGTTWTAAPNERVVVRTTSELAVLRATFVVRE